MQKRVFSMLALLVMALTLTVNAADTRAISAKAILNFTGTQANCSATISANNSSEKISATIKLWNGSTCLKTWSASGTGVLSFYQTAAVTKGQTYSLEVSYTVAGVSQPTVSATNTCP